MIDSQLISVCIDGDQILVNKRKDDQKSDVYELAPKRSCAMLVMITWRAVP